MKIQRLVGLLAVLSLLLTFAAVSPVAAATTCGHRVMDISYRVVGPGGLYQQGEYRIDAYACWNGTESWPGTAGQPTVTRLSGGPLGALLEAKGAKLLSDGYTTEFWANFKINVPCGLFPPTPLKFAPKIRVGRTGGASYIVGPVNPAYGCGYSLTTWKS